MTTLEKQIISEFIQMYKELPCLWDTSHALYSNRFARNRANDLLLEKFKEFDKTSDQRKMKKKLENMRTTYKRERTKVIKSQVTGGYLYEPSLWYYSLMSFLDEMNDESYTATSASGENTNDDGDADDDVERSKSSLPPSKRPKPTSVYLTESENDCNEIVTLKKSSPAKKVKKSCVYLTEDDNIFQEESSYTIKNEPTNEFAGTISESDLYGKTVSAQLNELQPKQRFIAEKLISEVIFFGRLDKLKTGTTLNLNSDCF